MSGSSGKGGGEQGGGRRQVLRDPDSVFVNYQKEYVQAVEEESVRPQVRRFEFLNHFIIIITSL